MSIEKEKSNYKQLFMDYCKDKIKNLGNITVDEEIMEDNYINDTKILYVLPNVRGCEYYFDEMMEREEIDKAQRKKIEKEFKLPEPFKYNVISRNGGADVEIYTPNISDLRATTTTMKGTKHIQEWFDIDGLWQVNILDDNGNFKKYEYVTGWQNAIKILENTLKKLTK